MAHNKTVVLSADENQARALAAAGLAKFQYGDVVTIDYIKRDGTEAVLTGHVVNFVGATPDKEAVVLLTDKGERSANLWRIKSVR